MKNATLNIDHTQARVVVWKTPYKPKSNITPFHLSCYSKWVCRTTLGKHIQSVHTVHNPAQVEPCAYCKGGLA